MRLLWRKFWHHWEYTGEVLWTRAGSTGDSKEVLQITPGKELKSSCPGDQLEVSGWAILALVPHPEGLLSLVTCQAQAQGNSATLGPCRVECLTSTQNKTPWTLAVSPKTEDEMKGLFWVGEGLRWLTIAILAPCLPTFFQRKENGVAKKSCLTIEDFKATPLRDRAGRGWGGCHSH